MTRLVVDASVAAKWYLEEQESEQARMLVSDRFDLHAPLFLRVEMDNILLKWMRRGEIRRNHAEKIRLSLRTLPIQWHSNPDVTEKAFEWAVLLNRSIYDSIYLALGAHLSAPVVSADDRLRNAVEEAQKRLGRRLVFSLAEVS